MSQVSRKYGAQHAEMRNHTAAVKRRAHRYKVAALSGALMLCPVIALPAESLRAPADPELTDLAARLKDRGQLSSEERRRLSTKLPDFFTRLSFPQSFPIPGLVAGSARPR